MTEATKAITLPPLQGEFEQIECAVEFPPAVDWEHLDHIDGTVKAMHTVKIKSDGKEKLTRLLALLTVDGERGVWESAGLRDLFDNVRPGDKLRIVQTGAKKIPGKPSPMRTFEAYRMKAPQV